MENKTLNVDVTQAGNIDQQGNVLFLDAERLARKEIPFKRYENRPSGLGICDFFRQHVTYLNKYNWWLIKPLYRFFLAKSKWMKKDDWKSKWYKKVTKIAPPMEHNTGSVVMPLNVDITDQSQKVVGPIERLKESLKKAEFIGGMDTCLCREANGCADYPHDLGCLFLGEAGKTACDHGLGRQFTYEEACARIDRAAELGVVAQGVWIEFEPSLWGVRNDQMDSFLEICFCCPCCCVGMRMSTNMPAEERFRFHPSGWTAVPDRTKCIGCGACLKAKHPCPAEALYIAEDGKIEVNQDACLGCGFCVDRCPVDVLKMKQTMPMRADLNEYFDKEFNVPLRVWKDEEKSNG